MAAVVALMTLAGTGPALAQARPDAALYTVRQVPVRAEGASVVAAKEAALLQGQREALRILLERLTQPEDRGRLPSPTDAVLQTLVLGVSIDDERTPPRGYIATLTVSFIPQAVQGLLRQADVPFTDQRGRRLVVIPVWQGGPNQPPVLWEDPNPWRETWANRRSQGLVPLEAPVGDLDDVTAIDVTRAMAGDAAAVTALAERYEAVGGLLAVARLQPGTPAQVVVEATPVGAAADSQAEPITVTQPLPADQPAAEGLAQALAGAMRGVARQVDEGWKTRAVGFSGATAQLTALVPLEGRLSDWLEVRRRLEASPAVRETRLQALTKDRAQITVLYGGEPSRLGESLGRQGLSLVDEGGYWTLRPADTNRALPLAAPPAPATPPQLQAPQPQAPQLQAPQPQAPDLTRPSGTLMVR
ncbi:DUF2066 domain-containing protein [Novispirillum sp. DQ9]|uniref:DUF2066 domain-containing protein n=1 Tax=Novispirillum sp. DQ9 TaxID=3398612 RepID=UPI003C7E7EA6